MFVIGKLNSKKDIVTLPISPASFEVATEQEHQTVNVVGVGEILLKGNKKLDRLSFSSFFPSQRYVFSQADYVDPYELVKKIKKWEHDKTTLQISMDGSLSMVAVIQSFSHSEDDGTGDVKYSISFIQAGKNKGKRAQDTVRNKKYTCKDGDTFYKVARKTTGSTANAGKIAKYNKMKVNAKLKKGKKLVIKI